MAGKRRNPNDESSPNGQSPIAIMAVYDPLTDPDLSHIPREWLEEFEAARKRSLETRFRYSFIKTYKPVMDDATFRSFDTTADYRRWCEENLPSWLGYGRV